MRQHPWLPFVVFWALACAALGCSGDASDGAQASDGPDAGEPADVGEPPDVMDGSDAADGEGTPVLELTPELCNDPSKLQALVGMLDGGGMGEAFGGANPAQIERMMAAPTEGPFYMFNLIRYREQAVYPDGRQTDLTGREANALYSPVEFLEASADRPVYLSEVHEQLDGDGTVWDDIAVVRYPCPLAFFAMIVHPDFQARSIHKAAGVEETIVMVTHLQSIPGPDDPDQSEAAFPPTPQDPAFDVIHVMGFHDVAQYGPDTDEPERTGQEAWEMYRTSEAAASEELGHHPTAILEVQGAFIGDEGAWDQILMVHMSSMEGFEALLDDETRQAGQHHRLAALQNNHSLVAFPTRSQIPYADGEPDGGGGLLEVTEDGVGTLCSSDADCPGGGVDTCLSDGGGTGFCTREGCGAGDCLSPYLCCRDCAEALAAMLPFEGSACLPNAVADQLTAAPLSCTCD